VENAPSNNETYSVLCLFDLELAPRLRQNDSGDVWILAQHHRHETRGGKPNDREPWRGKHKLPDMTNCVGCR
jgi:hypothetical protein